MLHVYSPQEVASTTPVPDQPSTIRQVAENISPVDAPTSASTADVESEEQATVSLQDGAEFSSAPYSSYEQPMGVPGTASQQQQVGTVNHIPNSMVWLQFLILTLMQFLVQVVLVRSELYPWCCLPL